MVLSEEALQARREYQRNYMKQYRATHKQKIKSQNEKSAENYWEKQALKKKVNSLSVEMIGYMPTK